MRICFFFFMLAVLQPHALFSQAIDNTLSYRNITSDHYTRINYENDFFTGTDRDYTQGIYIERVSTLFNRFLLARLLWKPQGGSSKYGIAIEDDGYTPNEIDRRAIQYGDRPYAGALFLKTFVLNTNEIRHERISSSLSTGIIGQSAGGAVMQKAIHHWIHYTQPKGWSNQIRNDIVLNYQVNYERELYSYADHVSFSVSGTARAGTLSTKGTIGASLMAGNIYSPFRSNPLRHSKKVQYYFYDSPSGNAVAYDCTLQGGIFNRTSPYTISNADINRFTFMNRFGFVLIFRHLYLEYFQSVQTPEFSNTIHHKSGGLQLGFSF